MDNLQNVEFEKAVNQLMDTPTESIEGDPTLSQFETGMVKEETPKPAEEIKPEPTEADKIKESLKFYQTNYQEALGKLKQKAPKLYDEIKGELKQERVAPQPVTITPQAGDDDYLTASKAREIFSGLMEQGMERVLQKSHETISAQAEMQAEDNYAGQILSDFRVKNKITDEQLKEAVTEVSRWPIDIKKPGGLVGFTEALITRLTLTAVDAQFNTQVTQASAEAAGKAKTILTVSQPTPSAAAIPVKTKNQEFIDMMEKTQPQDAKKELFGVK